MTMTLPKIDKPMFEINIPSINKWKLFRPFTVKEEKILLMAQQSGSEKDIIIAIKQVIQNCCQDTKLDVDDLSTFDFEYIFLKLRSLSVNNVIEQSYRDNEDNKIYTFEIDLDEVIIKNTQDEGSNVVKVTDEVGIVMKYPSVKVLENSPENATAEELVEYLIRNCIDSIYDATSVYPISETTDEELNDWLDQLDVETFENIKKFFENVPQMYYKIEYTNANGNVRVIELTSLNDFFTWR